MGRMHLEFSFMLFCIVGSLDFNHASSTHPQNFRVNIFSYPIVRPIGWLSSWSVWALFFQPACCWQVEWVDPDTVDWVGGTDYVDPVLPARAICNGGDSCCDGIECGVSSLLNLSSSLLLLGLKVYIYCLAWVLRDPVKSSDTKCLFEDCDWMFTYISNICFL